jgi:hypothetical protein
VNFWMTAGPRNLHTTDQKVWGSNPYGRALLLLISYVALDVGGIPISKPITINIDKIKRIIVDIPLLIA